MFGQLFVSFVVFFGTFERKNFFLQRSTLIIILSLSVDSISTTRAKNTTHTTRTHCCDKQQQQQQ